MKNFKYIKNHFQFWVLQVTLFFSVFAFTGYNAKAEVPVSNSFQTELVLSKKNTNKKVISIRKVISLLTTVIIFSQQFKLLKVELKNHHQLLKVKFKAVFQKFISFYQPILFFKKRIPSFSSDKDFPIFSIR